MVEKVGGLPFPDDLSRYYDLGCQEDENGEIVTFRYEDEKINIKNKKEVVKDEKQENQK